MQQIGRYQIIERLGRGAMGVVYKALDPRIGRTVAVKSIRLAEISDASELKRLRDRLEREARSAGALSHRNIVAIYDILEEEKLVHLFMEYVNGPSLDKLLTEGKLPEKDMLLNFFRQVGSALDYAHKIGIVHRDVKPSNLLIHFEHATGEQLAKVTDFGVAKFISQQMTQAGSMMGTPNYMAPEQIEGGQITGQADQFALAAVAYEVLCGEKPFVADYIPTLFFRIVREDPKAANQVNPSLSQTINRVLQRGLAKAPGDRFDNCTAFINALSEALDATPEWAPPYRMVALEAPPPAEAEHEPSFLPLGATAAFGAVREGQSRSRQYQPPEETAYQPAPPAADHTVPPPEPVTEDQPKGPVILPYDLPYRLPELRRGRKDEEEGEELPLWRRIAIVILLFAMVALAYAVYRNYTGAASVAGRNTAGSPSADSDQTAQPPSNSGSGAGAGSTPGANAPANTNPSSVLKTPPPAVATPPAQLSLPANPNNANQPSKSDNTETVTPLGSRQRAAAASRATVSRPYTDNGTPVSVEFRSEPSGARIVVDSDEGKSCVTPCSIALRPGRHTLTIAEANYGLARRIIEVPDQREVFVPLSQNIAIVQLDSVPNGSTVFIDGRLQGQTPATLKLTPGPHQVRLVSGNKSLQQTIQVSAESLQSFLFRWQ